MAKTAVHEFSTVKGVEIFQVGTWNGLPWTHDDLAEIERNFPLLFDEETGRGLEPPLVVGHEDPGEKGNWLENSGIPAAGYVRNVRKIGPTLFADFVDVPELLAKLIGKRRYKNLSAEIYMNYVDPNSGKEYGKALRRVALLGGDLPAVGSLQDIPVPMHRDSVKFAGGKNYRTVTFNTEEDMSDKSKFQDDAAAPADDSPEKDGSEVLKAIQDMGDRLSGLEQSVTTLGDRLTTLEAKVAGEGDDKGEDKGEDTTAAAKNASEREKELSSELAAAREKNTAQLARIDKIERERFSERVHSDVERLKKAGKFIPALEDAGAVKFMESLDSRTVVHKFHKDGQAVEQTQYDRFLAMFDGLADDTLVKFGETAPNGENADAPNAPSGKFDEESEKIDREIRKFQKNNKIETYAEAVRKFNDARKSIARN